MIKPVRILRECYVEVTPPSTRDNNMADVESDCQEFVNFVRSHSDYASSRSSYGWSVRVVREYEDCCPLCRDTWETDHNGQPLCCDAAIEEWDKEQEKGGAE